MYRHCDDGQQSQSVVSQFPLNNLSAHSGLRYISSSESKPLHSLTICCHHHFTGFYLGHISIYHFAFNKQKTRQRGFLFLTGVLRSQSAGIRRGHTVARGLHRYVGLVLVLFCPFSAGSLTLCILRCCGARQLKASLFLRVSGSLVLRERALSCTVSALDSAWRCSQMEKPCLEDVLWDIKALLVHCF